ncbi:putative DNA-directed RNA polymerase III subunit RPC7 [Rosellinia necatrix]|uniref:DNA-directed RNA polymerase III subunit n=1 Tax=Rosellinia necatrix TaxID=77044 RepID=A0A1W2TPM9_ROSNE|nr:putative DNA-directed RNA polymerase III subunit RPC7 [Rosellinia necatrix]
MSGRGGRGGRGGGRGGSRGKPAPPGMPGGDDPSLIVNDQPQETYPTFYKPLVAPHLTPVEERAVACFIRFRRAYHTTPLYTHRHINDEFRSAKDPVLPRHGRPQINARYGVKNRATIDPFVSVPMYSHRFVDDTRTLPKLRDTRPWVKDLFPEELWGTLDGRDTGGPKGGFQAMENASRGTTKRRLYDMEDDDDDDEVNDHDGDGYGGDDVFGWGRSRGRRENETEEERKARIEGAGKDAADNEEGDAGDPDDEDEEEMEVEDDDYESAEEEEGGDYNAEAYFDNGDDDDFGDDDGVGESAMDF